MRIIRTTAFALACALAACSPALDWREVRAGDSGATLLMPCRPQVQTRGIRLAGQSVQLTLHACTAGGQTWAIAFADMGDPAVVSAALADLRDAAASNIGARAVPPVPWAPRGATPNAASGRFGLTGRLPDQREVAAQVALFSRGTRVFQATAMGAALSADAVDTFFSSLQLAT